VTGSTPFSIDTSNDASDNFSRSFKKLAKAHKVYKDSFVELIDKTWEDLINNPYPNNSRQEPLPGKIQLPAGWTFHKVELWFTQGASGQIRLMYLVNSATYTIKPVWIYTKEQFAKRPADADLKNVIREILDF